MVSTPFAECFTHMSYSSNSSCDIKRTLAAEFVQLNLDVNSEPFCIWESHPEDPFAVNASQYQPVKFRSNGVDYFIQIIPALKTLKIFGCID